MSDAFWKNPDWTRLERGALTGDAMRGIPRNDFPWKVADEAFTDAEGDAWAVRVLCHTVENGRKTGTVKARLSATSSCTVHDANLERMGLTPQRLRAMHDDCAVYEETSVRDAEIPIDELARFARSWISALKADLLLSATFNRKQKILWDKVRSRPVSPFAQGD